MSPATSSHARAFVSLAQGNPVHRFRWWLSIAPLGLKPRITKLRARAVKLSESRDTVFWRCTAQSCCWNLAEAKLVVSLLCLKIANKRRKRKRPAALGTGPASQVLVRHPGERSHSNSRPDRVGGLGIPMPWCFRSYRSPARARWAKVKGTQKVFPIVPKPGKRTMSEPARRKIVATQKGRWARVRAAKK